MFALSYTSPINPPGADIELTRDQVWAGLMMKCRDAKPFVKDMSRCDVLEETENTILREITFAGDPFKEFLTLYPPVQVHFARVGDEDGGFILNTVSDSEQGLMLTFTFALNFPGVEPGSAEEKAKGEGMKGAYIGAVNATLKRVRELAASGELG